MSDFQALTTHFTLSIGQGSTPDSPGSSPTIPSSSSSSEVGNVDEIIRRIRREKIPYIGIYKPGELGRETWRAVVPSNTRPLARRRGRGKGRGLRGQWESIVLSTPSRAGIDQCINAVRHLAIGDEGEEARPVGIRHIVNPHCDQDEGLRIVWPSSKGEREMKDWSRRDRMMREGKTVRAHSIASERDKGVGWTMPNMSIPHDTTPVEMAQSSEGEWDNTAWTRLV